MVKDGRYSVWFKTPVGEGGGDGAWPPWRSHRGDTSFAYVGNWEQDGKRFKATLSATRIAPGPPGVFGMDEIDITLAGYSDGGASAACTGFAKQSPGLKLEIMLVRLNN